MTQINVAEVIARRLEGAGYRREPSSFRVTSFAVEFSAVLSGERERSSDLVVILDTRDDVMVGPDGSRALQRVEALTLALDVAAWPVVVTAILAGPPLPTMVVETIGRSCRALTVSEETAEGIDDARGLDDRLRVLLPLEVEVGGDFTIDPISRVVEQLDRQPGSRFTTGLLEASVRGEDEVRKALVRELDQAIQSGIRA